MNAVQVVKDFESLCALTKKMREAADHGEWDKLLELERQSSQLVERMKANDEDTALDETSRQRVVQLIRSSLADDAEVRNKTKIWMAQLQKLMQSNQQSLRLNKAYGAV
jgi:Spy/CpxP family protein refolding chaperone